MLLLIVLVAMSVVTMTGGFGFRGGKYRGLGLVAGVVLIAVTLILVMGNHIH